MQEILITNSHPDGFAFALTEAGEQIFIPPYAIDGTELQRGKRYQAVLIENHKENQRERTPWMAVSVLGDTPAPAPVAEPSPAEPVEPAEEASVSERDEVIFKLICESDYMTSAELAEHSGMDAKTASNSAHRLFNAGRIAKAEVHNRVGEARASFMLWAESASKFVE